MNGEVTFISLFYDVPLFILLTITAYTDLAHHKIHNWLTLPMIIVGFTLHAAIGGFPELTNSLLGFFIGVGIFSVAYFVGGVGGGDVKLIAAIGALGGYVFVIWAIFYSALIGGLMALLVLIWKGKLSFGIKQTASLFARVFTGKQNNIKTGGENFQEIPYGFAIALGTFWVLMDRYLWSHG